MKLENQKYGDLWGQLYGQLRSQLRSQLGDPLCGQLWYLLGLQLRRPLIGWLEGCQLEEQLVEHLWKELS